MNVLEFLKELEEERFLGLVASTAYDRYKSDPGNAECTFPYFRTKFNNSLKEFLGKNPSEIPAPTLEDHNIADKIVSSFSEVLPGRETMNYMEGDEIPDIPDLMPTGTLFDEVISDRITSDSAKEEYMLKYGEEMPEELIEIGGFTRQCVDIVAGDPGKI